ncbi:hypothetical protein BKH46_07650 [Helicobacter sp. 12S02634-8]|uniref:diguanylate cyclase n=1 Tax=Helicobacter sp. 12S02634-8 TaxID=1476199 RepID=UPI000BA7CC5E|nr:diguanylate cyclase [Helicobacter sp. 12S02634-8]PAF46453.1 hypothetical protein BKH46_07650 [Helicobacter sp. 12S02634-8]
MGNSKEQTEQDPEFGSNVFFGKLEPETSDTKNDEERDRILEDQVTVRVNEIAQNTLKQLEEEDLTPLPANYQLYFERLLEKEEGNFKQKIQNAINLQSFGEEHAIAFEKSVKDGFKNIKQMLDFIAILYKNLQLMQAMTDRHIKGIEKIDNNKIALSNATTLFVKDIEKINSITATQLSQIKNLYAKTAKTITDINQNTIYDSRFGVYNRRYFSNLIEKETKLMEEFRHSSSILVMALSQHIQEKTQEKSTLIILLKTVSKLLLKNSRRSDFIGYLGDGVFGIGLKYSDLDSAIKATDRFANSVKSTNIFLGDRDITLDVCVGIAKITPTRNAESSLKAALDALQVSLDKQTDYEICPEDR